jgi:hypothetical protein
MKTILYAGYGANRDLAMLSAITGNDNLKGQPAVLQDLELCVQNADQVPDIILADAPAPVSPFTTIAATWHGTEFETYTIRRKKNSQVKGQVFELTEQERALIAEWEMIEFGWYKRMQVSAILENGEIITAETEGLGDDQEIDRSVGGLDYPTYLNKKEDMLRNAKEVRKKYLARQ